MAQDNFPTVREVRRPFTNSDRIKSSEVGYYLGVGTEYHVHVIDGVRAFVSCNSGPVNMIVAQVGNTETQSAGAVAMLWAVNESEKEIAAEMDYSK